MMYLKCLLRFCEVVNKRLKHVTMCERELTTSSVGAHFNLEHMFTSLKCSYFALQFSSKGFIDNNPYWARFPASIS